MNKAIESLEDFMNEIQKRMEQLNNIEPDYKASFKGISDQIKSPRSGGCSGDCGGCGDDLDEDTNEPTECTTPCNDCDCKEKTCNCTMETIMASGCQCGGK